MKYLHTEGVLSIAGPAGSFLLSGSGSTLVLSSPSVSILARGIRSGMGRKARRRVVAGNLDKGLRHAGLALEFNVGGRTVARLGDGARPSRLARWFDLGPVELRPLRLAVAWIAGRRGKEATTREVR